MSAKWVRRGFVKGWSALYLLAEAEHVWARHLPRFLQGHDPTWKAADTTGIDVGASLGVYALALGSWCKTVLAVEPNTVLAERLRQLQFDWLQVIEAAAGQVPGDGYLVDHAAGWRHPEAKLSSSSPSKGWSQACRVVALSSFLTKRRPLVVKIDVEGGELAVLRGMQEALNWPHVCLIVEIELRHSARVHETFAYLQNHNLFPHQLHAGALRRVQDDEIVDIRASAGSRIPRLRGIRNNYIFLKPKVQAPA